MLTFIVAKVQESSGPRINRYNLSEKEVTTSTSEKFKLSDPVTLLLGIYSKGTVKNAAKVCVKKVFIVS